MIRIPGFAAAALLLSNTALYAAEGYWLSLEADDGTKAGLVYPDFQPNNFSVFWMSCPLNGGPAQLILEFPIEEARQGDQMPVSFIIDNEPLRLTGRAELDEFQSNMVVRIEMNRNDAFFDKMAKADKIAIELGKIQFSAPLRGAWSAINNFTNLCRLR